jgi:hypothetical protein
MKNNDNNLSVLSNELNLIKNSEIKELIKKILYRAPRYFWQIYSSEDRKYHPDDEYGMGGLILHTKRTVYLANKLCEMENIKGIQRDKLIGAMIIHDIYSKGCEDEPLNYSPLEHPFYIRERTKDLNKSKFYDDIINIVEAHLGRWTPNKFKIKKDKLSKFGHIADYLASRKEIEIKI